MAFGIDDAVAAVAGIGGKLIDRLWPDPTQAAAAKLELLKMQQSGELAQLAADTDLLKGQLAVNQVEATNPSLFTSGWRPAIGWVCATVLALAYIPRVVASTALWVWACYEQGVLVPAPPMDITDVLGLVMPMLGIAGMRSLEKIKGVAGK